MSLRGLTSYDGKGGLSSQRLSFETGVYISKNKVFIHTTQMWHIRHGIPSVFHVLHGNDEKLRSDGKKLYPSMRHQTSLQ